MTTNIFLTIFGIIFPAALSVLLYKFQKIKRYPSKLYYSIRRCSRVLQQTPSYEKLLLSYDDYQVKSDLFLVNTLIFNNRSSDVQCPSEKPPIQIKIIGPSKWVDVRIKAQSEGVEGAIRIIDNKEVQLSFPLLKRDEYIEIEGLIESRCALSTQENEIFEFNHRIPELDTIEQIPFVGESQFRRTRKMLKNAIVWSTLLILVLVGQFFLPKTAPLRYQHIADGQLCFAAISKDSKIVIENPRSFAAKPKEVITIKEFEENYQIDSTYYTSSVVIIRLVFFSIMLFSYIPFVVEGCNDIRKYKLVRRYKE